MKTGKRLVRWRDAVVLGLLIGSCMGAAGAQSTLGKTVYVDAEDEYSKIEVEPSRTLMNRLRSADAKQRSKAADDVLAQPSRYNPAVLFATADTLFERGESEQGTFWFAVAHMRAVADSDILTDKSAQSGVGVLMQVYGARFRPYAIANPEVAWTQMNRAMEWDRTHPQEYDRRWLALHGIRAVNSAMQAQQGQDDGADEITIPKDQWAALDEQNRQKILANAKARYEASRSGQGTKK